MEGPARVTVGCSAQLRIRSAWSGALTVLILLLIPFASIAQEMGKLSILGVPADPAMQSMGTNEWALYLSGDIDAKAGERLEDYILHNKVPARSWAILNSPGGSVVGGMELGRVIRKYQLRTDVAARKANSSSTFDYDVGACYSSCTLAYVGGYFRFLHTGSHFGIHRFAFTSPQANGTDLAQVTSALIVEYLRSMDIDPDLFTLSTTAGPDQIYEPSREKLTTLNVVTDGFNKPKWSIESNNGLLYLKGERDTEYGINKFILSGMVLHIIFDPQRHDEEALSAPAHTLMIDNQEYRITAAWKKIMNGWFNSEYVLTMQQLVAIGSAKTVGVIVQSAYGAPLFLGFDSMPFEDGANKLVGLMRSCSFAQ